MTRHKIDKERDSLAAVCSSSMDERCATAAGAPRARNPPELQPHLSCWCSEKLQTFTPASRSAPSTTSQLRHRSLDITPFSHFHLLRPPPTRQNVGRFPPELPGAATHPATGPGARPTLRCRRSQRSTRRTRCRRLAGHGCVGRRCGSAEQFAIQR